MKKISYEAALALLQGRRYTSGNMHVSDGIMYLHGNEIARYDRVAGTLRISNGGWDSVTTKDRLNAVLSVFKTGLQIVQRSRHWYIAREGTIIPIDDYPGWCSYSWERIGCWYIDINE